METGGTSEQTFSVGGMTCASCAQEVEDALNRVPGVRTARVTLDPARAQIQCTSDVDAHELANSVAMAGDYTLGERLDDMRTAVTSETSETEEREGKSAIETYRPLVILVVFLLIASVAPLVWTGFTVEGAMANFMGAFFLAFSFFKMLDLPGFVTAFRSYDLVARAWPTYAWLYPFIELALGAAYLARAAPAVVNVFTLIVMLAGSAGVVKSMVNKRQIRCACLGTVIDLPVGAATLIEDLGMGAMAAIMLILQAAR